MTERFLPDLPAGDKPVQIREIIGPDGTVKRYRAIDANFHRRVGVAYDGRNNPLGFGERPGRSK